MSSSSMKSINFPKTSNSINYNPPFSTKNLNFLIAYPNIVKTQKYPSLILALCSRTPHTHNQNDNTIGENPNSKSNAEFGSNSSEIDTQKTQPKFNSSSIITPPALPSRGLIFGIGQNGGWDSAVVGSPVVKRFLSDEEERWYMWYYGRSEKDSDSGSAGLAISSNGVHWERGELAADSSSGTGVVMTCGENWWGFDIKSIRPSEIMIMSSQKVRASMAVYWLYYTGFSSEKVELLQDNFLQITDAAKEVGFGFGFEGVFKSLPGLAISQDGRNWARIEGDHHSGALFDVGSKGEWDSLFIASPHVVFHSSGDLRMYYHSFDPEEGKFSIGMARSRDGIKWVKLGKVKTIRQGSSNEGCFDEMGILNACVVRDKKVGNYLMAYEGVDRDGKRSIGMAVSEDGLKDWKPVSDKAVYMASKEEDGWDSRGVGSPCLVQMDGDEDQWRLYYTGLGVDGRTGIGLAVSHGSEFTSFRRWAGFHL
ncbi:hypothetical protein SOVF_146370 [Spinacia oleracea]|uniref:Glycosyl hydrolase family 32 N-terminal domain-containing protein n=1 Tax=Spinacia oleracea TaxID=3562 RepID=A0A9R0HW84_SPIOL|nr:uncharacterized protein LOC110777880 [Spinacia oleracea]KNA10228.1 hypothetical protein SOVF_146370 [Spinacia oleracea]